MREPGADGGSDPDDKPRMGRIGGTIGFLLVFASLFLPRSGLARLILTVTGLVVLVVSGVLYDRR